MPINQPGARRADDRRKVSGILHMLHTGGRWRDVPAGNGPATMVYNRFNSWSRRGFWRAMLTALAEASWIAQTTAVDSIGIRVHCCAHGGEESRGRRPSAPRGAGRPPRPTTCPTPSAAPPSSILPRATAPAVRTAAPGRIRRLLADRGYDADWSWAHLRKAGIVPVIPGTRSRKLPIRHDKRRYKSRWQAEAAFCRLKDFRRVATRYDKLDCNYAFAVALASVIAAFWC